MNPIFTDYTPQDVAHLISEYPLAWVVSRQNAKGESALLPLIGKYDADGRLVSLIGHMAKSNPLHSALKASPSALILFQGPQGYVSPEHAGRRNWGPTWNYASLQIEANIALSQQMTEYALNTLITPCEHNRPEPWSASELGERYENMLDAIIGFEAKIIHIHGIFKLGQDENIATFNNIIDTHPDAPLRDWMLTFKKTQDTKENGHD